MSLDWTHGLNAESFFRKDGLASELSPRIQTTVGREQDGSWYIHQRNAGRGELRSVLTPEQMLNLCLGTLATMERYGMTIPLDWRRWAPPR